jgi:hypothetical protein
LFLVSLRHVLCFLGFHPDYMSLVGEAPILDYLQSIFKVCRRTPEKEHSIISYDILHKLVTDTKLLDLFVSQ